ncbi:MAG: sulfotransferase family 2 domain-containing protein, partial [Pseudomonadota bacterium]
VALSGPEWRGCGSAVLPENSQVRDGARSLQSRPVSLSEQGGEPAGAPSDAPSEDHFHTVVRDIDAFRRKRPGARQFPRIDFEMFLRWLQNGGSVYTQDEHWTSQSVLLHQPEVRFDFIGRFENLAMDAARILKEIGCDKGFPSQQDVGFAATGAQSKLNQYYNAATLQLVNDIFAEDFENFGYVANRQADT